MASYKFMLMALLMALARCKSRCRHDYVRIFISIVKYDSYDSYINLHLAAVVELVDTYDSKSYGRKSMSVRFRPAAIE